MNISVVGDLGDLTLVYVAHLARRRGLHVIELSEDALGSSWAFSFDDRQPKGGRIVAAGDSYSFGDVAGMYVRLSSEPELPADLDGLPDEEKAVLIRERRSALQYLLNRFPGVVANRPAAGRSNGSKPYQMRQLAQAGFRLPRWVASNDLEAIDAFLDTCGAGAIYKSCSGLRSRARLFDDAVRERLEEGTSPIVVQEYVPGADVRVHTVNDQVFATKVISEGVDYRFSGTESDYESIDVPEDIALLMQQVARQEGLTIAGFDFRVTDEGRWFCLEVNPVPTFLPYEMLAGQPIGDALLDVMVS